MHEAGAGGEEAADSLVEGHHVLAVVDEQPLAAGGSDRVDGTADDGGSQALMLVGRVGFRVDEERVVCAVPRDVDEADQLTIGCSARNPAEGVRTDPIPPAGFG